MLKEREKYKQIYLVSAFIDILFYNFFHVFAASF